VEIIKLLMLLLM